MVLSETTYSQLGEDRKVTVVQKSQQTKKRKIFNLPAVTQEWVFEEWIFHLATAKWKILWLVLYPKPSF